MNTAKLTDEQAWELVNRAGFTADDVAAVAADRARREHENLLSALALAETMYEQVWGDIGLAVPAEDRHGRGGKLTLTDCDGARRVVAAQLAEARRRAEEPWDTAGNVPSALRALARRERDGDHDGVRLLIDLARRGDSTGIGSRKG